MPWNVMVLTGTYSVLVWILSTVGAHLMVFIANGFKLHSGQAGLPGLLFPYTYLSGFELLLPVFVSVALAAPLNYWLFIRCLNPSLVGR